MGSVNFNTDVDKTVDITKNVFLDVNKDVFSFVDIEGSLATAEASADAIGGSGTTTGEREKVEFIPDANAVLGGGGTAAQQIFANPSLNPDGFVSPASADLVLPGSDTDFTSEVTRSLAAEVLSGSGQSNLGVNTGPLDKIGFNQNTGTDGNAYVSYEIDGGEDPFPLDDNAGIIADYNATFAAYFGANPPASGDLTDLLPEEYRDAVDFFASPDGICYQYTFDIDFDPGEAANTARASFIIWDTDGNYALTTAALVPDDNTGTGFSGLEFTAPFAAFIDPVIASSVPNGTVIAAVDDAERGDTNANADSARIVQLGVEIDVDGNGDPVNLDNLAGWQLLFEDAPEDTLDPPLLAFTNADIPVDTGGGIDPNEPGLSSADFIPVDSVIDENLSEDGTDAAASLVWTTCIEQPGGEGNLAETDTFAQVSPEGAFSFSESLAASMTAVDNFDLG